MVERTTLSALRVFVRDFRAKVATGSDPQLLNLRWEFAYCPSADGEERITLTEDEFWAEEGQGRGWPRPGLYFVRAVSEGTGIPRLMFDRTGILFSPDHRLESYRERSGGETSHVLAWSRSHSQRYDELHADLGRERTLRLQAEERERRTRDEWQAQADAIISIKKENLALRIERDEHLVRREEAEELAEIARQELEEVEARGAELAPVASQAVATAVDRFFENMGFQSHDVPAAYRDAIEEIAVWVVSNPDVWPELVELGLPYGPVRLLLQHAGMDPGPNPPAPGTWHPPTPSEEPEAVN